MSHIIYNILFYLSEIIQVLIFIAGCYFFGISIFGWVKLKEPNGATVKPQKRFALIVAAHNEEAVIAQIIESLFKLNYPQDLFDVFVIADNCSDNTAAIASNLGANVHIRCNEIEKGRG